MYNIKVLEDEWKRYNRKKKRPWIIGAVFLSIVSMILIFVSDSSSLLRFLTEKKIKSDTKQKNITVSKKVFINTALNEPEEKKLSPVNDMPIDSDVSSDENNEKNHIDNGQITDKKFHIEVVEADSKNAYKEVEKRFRLGHDIDDSLFLAKAYYLKGQYKKAEYWALQTNKINENIEESWLIFIKSKVKRGQKNEAMRILNTYIKKTDSSEAKVLLEKIKKGIF